MLLLNNQQNDLRVFQSLDEWFSHPISEAHPEVEEMLMKKAAVDYQAATYVFTRSRWKFQDRPRWLTEETVKKAIVDLKLVRRVESESLWELYPKMN